LARSFDEAAGEAELKNAVAEVVQSRKRPASV
jgi:hypothetical protein